MSTVHKILAAFRLPPAPGGDVNVARPRHFRGSDEWAPTTFDARYREVAVRIVRGIALTGVCMASVLVAPSASASSVAPEARTRWGALAVAPPNHAWGYGWSRVGAHQATNFAVRHCELHSAGEQCIVYLEVKNSWGAVASSTTIGKPMFTAHGPSEQYVRDNSLKVCRIHTKGNCYVLGTVNATPD